MSTYFCCHMGAFGGKGLNKSNKETFFIGSHQNRINMYHLSDFIGNIDFCRVFPTMVNPLAPKIFFNFQNKRCKFLSASNGHKRRKIAAENWRSRPKERKFHGKSIIWKLFFNISNRKFAMTS